MRLVLDPRAWRPLRRMPRYDLMKLLELALLVLLAVQLARLLWAIFTPVGPLGDWRLPAVAEGTTESQASVLKGFDPFFRLQAGGGTAVVTSLQLTLYGTRVDEAMGRGSAIISGPDDIQNSYAVGDEILPGVVLKDVTYDGVTILRGQTEEKLFIDQSVPAPAAPVPATPVTDTTLDRPAVAPGSATLTAQQVESGIQFLPRTEEGRVTGFVVRSRGSGEAFRVAGFRDGDIVVAINGRPVTSPADLQRAASGMTRGGNIGVSVERGADVVPITITMAAPK